MQGRVVVGLPHCCLVVPILLLIWLTFPLINLALAVIVVILMWGGGGGLPSFSSCQHKGGGGGVTIPSLCLSPLLSLCPLPPPSLSSSLPSCCHGSPGASHHHCHVDAGQVVVVGSLPSPCCLIMPVPLLLVSLLSPLLLCPCCRVVVVVLLAPCVCACVCAGEWWWWLLTLVMVGGEQCCHCCWLEVMAVIIALRGGHGLGWWSKW